MKTVYYKLVDNKGRVLIPYDLRKTAKIQENDIIRLCSYNKMIIMERVELPSVDLVGKLRQSLSQPEKSMPDDAVDCFVLAAIARMGKEKQATLLAQISKMLDNPCEYCKSAVYLVL